ncbi:MAG: hypothetical protein IJW08_06040 [Lentisphaeria bacterium]|nr:hypothetical protein [Lentisphaeria bacterium]
MNIYGAKYHRKQRDKSAQTAALILVGIIALSMLFSLFGFIFGIIAMCCR